MRLPTKESCHARMEWLRADDSTPECWACFLVYPDKVSVLATLTNGLVDRDMSVDAARQLWIDLRGPGRGIPPTTDESKKGQGKHRSSAARATLFDFRTAEEALAFSIPRT
jgi:hypothetical protein